MTHMRHMSRLTMAVAVAVLGGCTVQNNNSIAILFNAAAQDDCTYAEDPDQYIPSGTLDILGGHGYFMAPHIENRLKASVMEGVPERNEVTIRAVEVDLELVDCADDDNDCLLANEAVVAASQTVPSTTSIPPGVANTVLVDVPIPVGELQQLMVPGQRYVVHVTLRAVGGRNADEELKSGDFHYYVTICENCLLRGHVEQTPCPGGSGTGDCGRAQDGVLDCCYVGADEYCPASDFTPPTP